MQTLSQLLDRINSIIWGTGFDRSPRDRSAIYRSQRLHSGPSFPIHHAEDAAGAMEKGGYEKRRRYLHLLFQALCTAIASCVGRKHRRCLHCGARRRPRRDLLDVGGGFLVGMATKYGEIILGLLSCEG